MFDPHCMEIEDENVVIDGSYSQESVMISRSSFNSQEYQWTNEMILLHLQNSATTFEINSSISLESKVSNAGHNKKLKYSTKYNKNGTKEYMVESSQG